MRSIAYISLEDALYVHTRTVVNSGGGMDQCIDSNRLDSILTHIQNDDYYPNIEDKLAHLFFCVCKFHCFADGNKRLAITLSTQFLLINGYMYIAKDFIGKTENISFHVAAGNINKELLHEIFSLMLIGEYDNNEEIKIKLYEAIRV
ncbi:type II toxin-antitoxin system death-on-curing family toxin [Sporosarcina ureae]|uniref:type II toxin-antitoxin system death-on-curing family toxin n=1 Tax=Sporosarcina ureae TaxID=1571 RepID=UPI000A17CA91|nr:type II toxin-antitoxin system death-on-curing family toxin [Sporosarcina ureae]ARK21866.1 death-on-curing protein [Sporosarcina ureae]